MDISQIAAALAGLAIGCCIGRVISYRLGFKDGENRIMTCVREGRAWKAGQRGTGE